MAKNRESTRYKSNLQEKRIASHFAEGKQVIGSGSTPFLKGDVVTDDLFIECKTKIKESKGITVKREWVEKAKEQAYQMRKQEFALALSFGESGEDYFLIEDRYFVELYHKAKALDGVWEALNTKGLEGDGLVDVITDKIQEQGLYW